MGKYDIGGNISKSNKDSLMFLHDFDDTLDDLKEKSKVKYRYDLDLKDRAKADELYSKFQEQSKNGINNYFTTIPTALRKATQAYKEYNEQEDKSSENSKQLMNETVRWGNAYLALGGEIDETSKKMFDFVKVQTEVLNKKTGGGYNYTKEKFEDIFSTIKELMDYVDDFRIFSSNFTVNPKLDISSIKEKAKEAQEYLDNIYENDYYRNGGIFSENEEKNLLKYLGFLSQYYKRIKHLSDDELPKSFTYADKGGYNLYRDRNNNNSLVYEESIKAGMKDFSTMISSARNSAVKKVKDEQLKLFDEIKQGYQQSTKFINDLIDEVNSKLDESAKKIQFISQEQVNIIRSSRSFEELRPVYDETGKQEGSYINKDSFTSASQKYDELFDQIRDGVITSDEAIEEMSRHFFEAFKQGNAIGYMTDDVKELKREIDSLLSQLNSLKNELAEAKADASSWENVASSELDQRINYEVQNEKLLKKIDDQQQQIDNLERQIKLQNSEYDLRNDSDYTGYGNGYGYGYGAYGSSDISNNLLSDIDGYLFKIHNIINSFNFDIFNGFPSFTNSVTSYLDLIYSMTVDIYNLFKNSDGKINITNISNLSGNFDSNSPLQKKYKELSGYLDLLFNPVKSRSKFNSNLAEDEIIKQSTFTTIDKVSGRTIAVNFSPILVDENGKQIGVMSAKELKKYAQDVLNNVRPDDLKLRGNIFQGENAEIEAKKAAENLFNSQLRLQSRKSQSFQYSVNFEEIASAIVQNIPSVSNKFGGDINKFLSQYDPSIIQGLPNVAERVDRITDLLGWIKQLSKGKNIFDPEIAKVIKSAGKNIPSIDELTKENENSNTTIDDILNQMLSQLKEITHQISLVVDSLTLSGSNDVPNLQDEYLNTRNRNLKQLYSDIDTDSKGNISTKKSNVPKIQAFMDQFYKYGEGQWDLKEFGRLNNISAKSLNVLKEYYDELKNANISVEDSIEKVNDSLIEQKDILSSPVSDSSSELKQEEQAALDTSDSIDKLNQSKIENAKVNNVMNDSCLETSVGLDKEGNEAKETANEIDSLNKVKEEESNKNGLSSDSTTNVGQQIKLQDNLGREIDENNSKILQGTKLLDEQTQQVLTLYHNSEKVFDTFNAINQGGHGSELGDGNYLAGDSKSYNNIDFGRYQTQWYAFVEKIFDIDSKFSAEEIQKLIHTFLNGTELEGTETFNNIIDKLNNGSGLEAVRKIARSTGKSFGEIFGSVGYDAIAQYFNGNIRQINVFDPSKIVRANDIVNEIPYATQLESAIETLIDDYEMLALSEKKVADNKDENGYFSKAITDYKNEIDSLLQRYPELNEFIETIKLGEVEADELANKIISQSDKSDISLNNISNAESENKLQEDLKESQNQAEKTAESLKEIVGAQSKVNEEKKESIELSREENNVINNIPEMINKDAVSEEKSLSQVTEETSNSLKTEGDIAEVTSQKLDKLSEAKRRLIEYEEKLSGATKETSDKLKEEGSSAKEASKNVGKANSVNNASGSSKSKEKPIDYLKQANKLYEDIQKKGNKYADLKYISENSMRNQELNFEKSEESKVLYKNAKDEINKFYANIYDLYSQNRLSFDEFEKIRKITDSGQNYSPIVSNQVKAKMRDEFKTDVNKITDKLDFYISPTIDEEEFNEFKNRVEKLKKEIEGIEWINVDEQKINSIKKEFKDIQKDYDDRKSLYTSGNSNTLKNLLNNATSLASNSYVPLGIKSSLNQLVKEMEDVDRSGTASANTIQKFSDRLNNLRRESNKAGKSFLGTIANRLKDMNAKFIATYFSMMDIMRYLRNVIDTITELDTALTEMRKVSDESIKSLKEYQQATFDTANAIGTTAVELQNSTAGWMRLGESIDKAAESAKEATILMNVSEFSSIDEATQSLVSMSQAYQDLSKGEIVDVLNKVGNEYPIATDELATALQSSAATLMTQGNNLYEAVALITAGNAVIQDANKVGSGIRTISLRIAGTNEAKAELEELGEEVEDYVVMTEAKKRQIIKDYTSVASNNGQGVDIIDPNGNLKNTYEILLEISKVYKEIQEEDKKYGTNRAQGLVEELAGKNRSNIAASILMNPDTLESVYNASQNAEGSAQEELDKYLDSINGKVQQFKNELQELESNLVNSELIKSGVDFATKLIDVINDLIKSFKPLSKVVLGVGAGILLTANNMNILTGDAKNLPDLFNNIQKSLNPIKSLIEVFSNKDKTNSFKNILNLRKNFDVNFKYWKISDLLNNKDIEAELKVFDDTVKLFGGDLSFVGEQSEESFRLIEKSCDRTFSEDMKKVVKGGITTVKQYGEASENAAASQKVLAAATTVAKVAINSLISVGVSLAIGAIIKGVDYLIHRSEKLEELANEARDSIKELNEELENNKRLVDESGKRYAELAQNVKDFGKTTQSQGTLSNDEYAEFLDLSNQLVEVFPGLQSGFDSEGNAILNLNGNINTINNSLKEYVDLQKEIEYSKMLENAESIFKDDYNKYRKKALGDGIGDYDIIGYERALEQIDAGNIGIGSNIFNVPLTIKSPYDAPAETYAYKIRELLYGALGEQRGKELIGEVSDGFELDITEKEKKQIKSYYNQVINEYKKESQFNKNEIDKLNKDLQKYMYMYLQNDNSLYDYYSENDVYKKQIIDDIVNTITFEDIEKNNIKGFEGLADWIQNEIVFDISQIDNSIISQKMIDIISDSVNPSDIEQAYNDIFDYLNSIGFTNEDEIVIYWKLKYDESSLVLDKAASHIEKSLEINKKIPIDVQNDERFGRARSWITKLTNNEIEKLMSVDLSDITIKSFDQLKEIINGIKEDVTETDFIDQFNHLLNDDKYKYVKEHLMDLSTEGKLDADTLKSYRGFNDILRDLGITLGEDDEKLQKALDLINDIAKSDGINALDKYSTDLSSLSDAYSSFANSELITPSQLKALKDSFGEFDSYKNFEEAVLSGDSNLQEHFNDLAAEMLYENLALKGLNKSNKDYYIQSLKTIGITNAQEVVEQALVNTQRERETVLKDISAVNSEYNKTGSDVIATTEQLENATSEELIKLALEAEQSGISASALANYALQKAIVEGTIFDESTEIDSLIKVAQMAGIAGGALGEYIEIKKKLDWFESGDAKGHMQSEAYNSQKKYWEEKAEGLYDDITEQIGKTLSKTEYSGLNIDFSAPLDDASGSAETFKEILDKILAMYDAELDAGVTSFKEYVNKSRSIIEQYYRDGKITAQEYFDSLSDLSNKQIAEYDKVINAVTRKINEQIDALNNQKESIEESYNLQIEEIQKKIDALQDENDEIDRNMALQKAQYVIMLLVGVIQHETSNYIG